MSKNTKLSGQPVICQLFSFIPDHIITEAVEKHQSDRYYKTMTTKKQLIFILYGVLTKCHSLNSLCKNLLFLEDKLMYIGVDQLPATSTLSDANKNRDSHVFGDIYSLLYKHYSHVLSDSYLSMKINGEADPRDVIIFDSTTVSLFVDIFKGAGRNPIDGKKKGGLKVQCTLPLSGFVPDVVHIHEAAQNDRVFLGQLNYPAGTILVFDKGYVKYDKYEEWSKTGLKYVTRLNENADYITLESTVFHYSEYANGGIIKDETILLKGCHRARLVTYKDPISGKVLKFLTNLFDFQAITIAMLYKCRWIIEVLFKQLKQNFELSYFFSDSSEGIKTQIWVALIANLLFSVIHRQLKEAEQFLTLVSMASNNLGSYICFVSLIKQKSLRTEDRDLKIIQLSLFDCIGGGVLQKREKPALNSS
jgi:IS4 transposase